MQFFLHIKKMPKKTKSNFPELHLNIKMYKEGICFICNKPCDPEGYVHYECCIAYSDYKEKRIKEAMSHESYSKDSSETEVPEEGSNSL